MEGSVGNDGFSVSMSFNPVMFQSAPADYIEVALKSVSLEFRPADATGWKWSEVITAFVRSSVDNVSIKLGDQATEGASSSHVERTGASIGADVGFQPLGKLKGNLQVGRESSQGRQNSTTISNEEQHTRRDHWVEMTRGGTSFNLRLDSPSGADLVRFNSELDRLSVLSAPEPGSIKPESVSVTMKLHLKRELKHAYAIRDAGGRWANLIESRNRQVVAELLIAKFLKSMHGPVRLWPPKAERAS